MSDTLQRTTPAERLAAQQYLISGSREAITRIEAHQAWAQESGDMAAYMQYEIAIRLLKNQLAESERWAAQLEKEVRHAH